jgi:FkbM family methyltransferase
MPELNANTPSGVSGASGHDMSKVWDNPEIFIGANGVKYLICRDDVITEAELIKSGKISAAAAFEDTVPHILPGEIILDIGAHYGGFGVWAAKQYPDSIVHAWEPQRQLFYELCGNIAINHLTNIYPHHEVVGRVAGEEILIPDLDLRTARNPGALRLRNLSQHPASHMPKTKIVTIDDYGFKNVRMMKIDVEGMEEEVIIGASKTIALSKPTIHLEAWASEKVQKDRLLAILRSFGYKKFKTDGDNVEASCAKVSD